jgi:molybdopterin-biosynthesis enzyme MoeA-like protein
VVGELRELGVAVGHIQVIPDVVEDIRDAVRADAGRFDHVLPRAASGGPTTTSPSPALAMAFGVGVVRHRSSRRAARLRRRAHLPAHLRMAEVPEGAALIGADHRRGR